MQYTEASELNVALWVFEHGDIPVTPGNLTAQDLGNMRPPAVDLPQDDPVTKLFSQSLGPAGASLLDRTVTQRECAVRRSRRRPVSSSAASSVSSAGTAASTSPASSISSRGKAKKPVNTSFRKCAVREGDFTREDLDKPEASPSILTEELAQPVRMRRRGGSGDNLRLVVYLPSREPMKVLVPSHCTVGDATREVLRLRQRATGASISSPSICFELRLHEDDGYPDEDFPALERDRQVSNFAQGGVHEYCLCEIPGAELGAVTTDTRNLLFDVKDHPEIQVVKLIMPSQSLARYALMKLQPELTAGDVIAFLGMNRMYRMAVYRQKYDVCLSGVDRARMKRQDERLQSDERLASFDCSEFIIKKRAFADSPAERQPRKKEPVLRKRDSVGAKEESKSTSAAQFGHNMLSAAQYQEWEVIKVNKRGRRQARYMGIDLAKISNRKIEKRRLLATESVQRPERLISDVVQLRVPDREGTVFFITFRENAYENITIEYQAKTAKDRRAIVSKLSYILRKDGKGDRIVKPTSHKR